MHKGLTQATLGVIGAALLSSSVFAAGPTLKSLPTVVITDKEKAFTPGAPYDNVTPATENRYRFTDAFDLADYVTTGVSAPAQVNFLFEEFASADGSTEGAQQTGTDRAITINGNLANESGSVDRAEVLASAIGNVADDGVLSFVDTFRSGGDGSVPGPDPGGAFTDYHILKMYVASSLEATGTDFDVQSFTVVTTNDVAVDEGDYLSVPTSIFTPVDGGCIDDFVGWFQNGYNQLPDFNEVPADGGSFAKFWGASSGAGYTPASPTGTSVSDTGNPAFDKAVTESPTDILAVFTDASPGSTSTDTADRIYAPQYGSWNSWRKDLPEAQNTVEIDADTVYMVRWTVSGDASTTAGDEPKTPTTRFNVSEGANLGFGNVVDLMYEPGTNSIVGTAQQQHRSYFYAPTGTPVGQEVGFVMDTFDFYQGDGGGALTQGATDYGIQLDKIEVFSFSRSDLDGESIEVDVGADAVTLAASQTAVDAVPDADADDFTVFVSDGSNSNGDDGDWIVTSFTYADPGNYTAPVRGITGTVASDLISASMSPGNANGILQIDARGYALTQHPTLTPDDTATEIVSGVANDKLVFIDAWLSSPEGASANNNLPTVRVGLTAEAFGETADSSLNVFQGRQAYIEFEAFNRTDAEDVGRVVDNSLRALETSAKRYTAVMEPLIRTGSTADLRPFILAWSFPQQFPTTGSADDGAYYDDTADEGTIRVHRVTVTTYDRPSDATTIEHPCD